MRENYDRSFELVVGHEGGFTDDRRDRGNWTSGKIGVGELKGTKYGVSAMAYPDLDIRNLTLDQAKAIYKRDYWDKVKADDLPAGLDFLTFDCAVNHGISNGTSFLQQAIRASADGRVGPQTLTKASQADPRDALIEMAAIRGLFYSQIGTVKTYGRGWYRRQARTLAEALDFINRASEAPLDQSNGSFLGGLFRRV
jgi:lysozyme family protein